ncbi:MAG: chemotaxis response regulator protein-glutamate methylesterase [Myxococcales bacterium]|nr:chemotaxis response regulator protein-glutamate methylesterase [Myxococcales bacterium]
MTPRRSSERSNPDDSRRPLHVLVVDDSAVVREIMGSVLSQDPGLTVATAADPLIAMDKMKLVRPDVILLDLEMPRMDGLTFLRKLMAEDPIPVVVCSGIAPQGTETALRALDEGALDIVTKPTVAVAEFLRDSSVMLIDAVRAASCARVRRRGLRENELSTCDLAKLATRAKPNIASEETIVAIGASTGGTEAIRQVLKRLPSEGPGCVIVQHMPAPFTGPFADRLDKCCEMEVREAKPGDRVLPGRALIAPGDRHILVRRRGRGYVIETACGGLVSRHLPSVDVLFHSVAEAAGRNAIGVILTGMGQDGAEGLRAMKDAGADTIAQDENSCVVFGMPREAIALGAVDDVATLPDIPAAILKIASRPARRRRTR